MYFTRGIKSHCFVCKIINFLWYWGFLVCIFIYRFIKALSNLITADLTVISNITRKPVIGAVLHKVASVIKVKIWWYFHFSSSFLNGNLVLYYIWFMYYLCRNAGRAQSFVYLAAHCNASVILKDPEQFNFYVTWRIGAPYSHPH